MSARPPTLMNIFFGFQYIIVHPHRMRALEARMAVINRTVFKSAHPVFHALVRAAGNLIFACFHPFHVDVDLSADGDAILAGALRQVRSVGARHQRLGRDAAGVNAGAAEVLALDDCHFHAGGRKPRCKRRPRLARANDDRVETYVHKIFLSRRFLN